MKNNVSTRDTGQKALRINLDEKKYGTIVEIGAGQEVARNFFKVGAAAGTIAKTMSAYDMKFSDAIYGVQEERRYVSKSRVQAMMKQEFDLVLERLGEVRSKTSKYFSYAATVAAKSFNRNNECHAWCGVRLQLFPGAEPSQVTIHVRMHDATAKAQQEALGTLGVNLIYAAYYYFEEPKKLIDSLTDNLENDQIEIDSIEFDGPYFKEIDNCSINLHLIRSWKTRAIMFKPDGHVAVPSELLYKKNVLTIRGSFKPVTKLNVDMIEQGKVAFSNYTNVMVSDYTRYFSLRAYFRQYTKLQIGIVVGIVNIKQIFDERMYQGVEGGILEGFGKLFPDNTRLYVYPEMNEDGEIIDYTRVALPSNLRHLYNHLLENEFITGIECSDKELFKIYSRDVLKQLPNGRGDWEQSLPVTVSEAIVKDKLFGFKG